MKFLGKTVRGFKERVIETGAVLYSKSVNDDEHVAFFGLLNTDDKINLAVFIDKQKVPTVIAEQGPEQGDFIFDDTAIDALSESGFNRRVISAGMRMIAEKLIEKEKRNKKL